MSVTYIIYCYYYYYIIIIHCILVIKTKPRIL